MCVSLSISRWFCHFDDDNYVNVPRLVKLLDEYSPSVDWYLGKPSISSPLEIHLDSVSANACYFCIFSYIEFVITSPTLRSIAFLQLLARPSPIQLGPWQAVIYVATTAICLCRHLASSCQRKLSLITDMIWRGTSNGNGSSLSLSPSPSPSLAPNSNLFPGRAI